ncbi:MAG: amino-acid N-acetyltransferase [Candidatus Competibacterales bacterium]
MSAPPEAFVRCFRQAGPYLNAHRGKTVVIHFQGQAIQDPRFDHLIHDIALLHSLGLHLVLVHGIGPQAEAHLKRFQQPSRWIKGRRLVDSRQLSAVIAAVGEVRIGVEAKLSMGLANSPMHGARIRVASGNFVTAKPVGVRDGVDMGFAGEVRRVDIASLSAALHQGTLVLLSPLGYSPTGEIFELEARQLAAATAIALRADKLVLLHEETLLEAAGPLRRQLTPLDVEQTLVDTTLPPSTRAHLREALEVLKAGVRRIHLIPRSIDGGLLLELFTRDGVGTMVSMDGYDHLRQAAVDDVGGLLALIQPLEEEGILVRRSRERLETEIHHFAVLERDGAVIGCAALYPFGPEAIGELACLAVHREYRQNGRADALLQYVERKAKGQRLDRLFVLTTTAAHWFRERGFEPAALDDLPVARRAMYNYQRRSQVLLKTL